MCGCAATGSVWLSPQPPTHSPIHALTPVFFVTAFELPAIPRKNWGFCRRGVIVPGCSDNTPRCRHSCLQNAVCLLESTPPQPKLRPRFMVTPARRGAREEPEGRRAGGHVVDGHANLHSDRTQGRKKPRYDPLRHSRGPCRPAASCLTLFGGGATFFGGGRLASPRHLRGPGWLARSGTQLEEKDLAGKGCASLSWRHTKSEDEVISQVHLGALHQASSAGSRVMDQLPAPEPP